MVARLKNIAPIQFAVVGGVLYAVLGLIGALFFVPFSMLGGSMAMPHSFLPALGLGALIVFPIAYGIMGFITTLIMSLLYNFVSSLTGGIEVTLETVAPAIIAQQPIP